jgi:Protein of unknown function DUF262
MSPVQALGNRSAVEFDEVEFEEENEDLEQESAAINAQELKEISGITLSGSDWTTATILDQLTRENIQLNPKFQRRDAWNITRKSRFIESLILGFPVPQIVLATNEKERGKFIVLDGKQRLLTILQFYGESATPNNSFALKDLEFRTDLKDLKHKDMKENVNLYGALDGLDNQTIRTIVIRNWKTEKFLHKIFLRLNVENTPLSSQELRQALHPGGFIDFLDDRSIKSQALKKIFKSRNPDFRMRDVELLLRYIAFHYYLPEYRGDIQALLDSTCEKLNQQWDDPEKQKEIQDLVDQFEEAVQTTINIFGEKNFSRVWLSQSKAYRGNFNRAVLDIMVFYFSDKIIREVAENNKEKVKKSFQNLFDLPDDQFRNYVEKTPKSIQSTYNRFALWGKALSQVLNLEFNIPELENNRIIFHGLS